MYMIPKNYVWKLSDKYFAFNVKNIDSLTLPHKGEKQ